MLIIISVEGTPRYLPLLCVTHIKSSAWNLLHGVGIVWCGRQFRSQSGVLFQCICKYKIYFNSIVTYILYCMYTYNVKVVVDGPPGQKVFARRMHRGRESGRIGGPVPLRTTLAVAVGCIQGFHLAQVCLSCMHAPVHWNFQFSLFVCLHASNVYYIRIYTFAWGLLNLIL